VGVNTTKGKTDVLGAVNVILAKHQVDASGKRGAFLARAGEPVITVGIGCTLSLRFGTIQNEHCASQYTHKESVQ